MNSDADLVGAKIRAIVHDFRSKGLFSEAFVECGFLDRNDPSLRIEDFSAKNSLILDLASLTKALVTYPLAAFAMKKLSLTASQPLKDWNLQGANLSSELLALTADQLLGHDSGLPAWRNFWINHLGVLDAKELIETRTRHIEDVFGRYSRWLNEPGKDVYSDVGYILLGYSIEKTLGAPFHELWDSFLKNELSVKKIELGFLPRNIYPKERFADFGYCALRQRQLTGEVHDENCAALGGVAGHAGLFGSGASVGLCLKALFAKGYLDSAIESAKSGGRLVGLRRGDDEVARSFGGGSSMGHWGFTGSGFWIKPTSLQFCVVIVNRTLKSRLNPLIKDFRKQIMTELNALGR
ncbi:MAG: hypothetical protein AB7T49_02665 [Oligoflexales bacterium]